MVASVLITGCTDDGIGSALAIRFAQRGLVVFATARSLQRMTQLTNISNIHLLELDIQDAGQVRAVVEAIQHETGGKLNYLVNNAGQNRFTPLLDEDIEQVKKLFDVNVYGALRVTQACAPMLMATKGKVVFTSSVSGWLNVPWQGAYAASKSAMEVMAETLRLELAPLGVRVVSVVTTGVKTNSHVAYQAWKMPSDSHYLHVENEFVKRAKGDDGAPRMATTDYAKRVVDKVLDTEKIQFWCGAYAGMLKLMIAWLPVAWMDKIVIQGTGIDVMMKMKGVWDGKQS